MIWNHVSKQPGINHASIACKGLPTIIARSEDLKRQNQIKFQKDSACFSCLLPTKICRSEGQDGCLLPPCVLWIWMYWIGCVNQGKWWFRKQFHHETQQMELKVTDLVMVNKLLTIKSDNPFDTECVLGVYWFYLWCEKNCQELV